MTRDELVMQLTAIVREADEEFQSEGGSSRHWVRDHFLPRLEGAGVSLLLVPPGEVGLSFTREEAQAMNGLLHGLAPADYAASFKSARTKLSTALTPDEQGHG